VLCSYGTPTGTLLAFLHCTGVGGEPFGMGKSERYRQFARACMEMVQTVRSARSRAALIHMAEVWLLLAETKKDNDQEDDC
jgi:hypothetical protein